MNRSPIPELVQQAEQAFDEDNSDLGYSLAAKILRMNGRNVHALYWLGERCLHTGKLKAGIRYARRGVRHHPEDVRFYELLGFMYAKQNKLSASIKAYEQALRLRPDEPDLQYLLASAKQDHTIEAPREYIEGLFNAYAPRFEKSLLEFLQYSAPSKLAEFLRVTLARDAIDTVCDLGCGTGLLGVELTRNFQIQKLVGVDLAQNMLEQSSNKGIYQELHQQDLLEFLRSTDQQFDLLASSDVLIYFGDLQAIFTQAHRCLKPGGYLAFTIEKLPFFNQYSRPLGISLFKDYILQPIGRFQHRLKYIQSLYKKCQFSKMYCQTIDLRKESGKMVQGYSVLLQK